MIPWLRLPPPRLIGSHLCRGAKIVIKGLQELAKAGKRGGHDGKVHDGLRRNRELRDRKQNRGIISSTAAFDCIGCCRRRRLCAQSVAQVDESKADGDGDEELSGKGRDHDEFGAKGHVETEDEGKGQSRDEDFQHYAERLDGDPALELIETQAVLVEEEHERVGESFRTTPVQCPFTMSHGRLLPH